MYQFGIEIISLWAVWSGKVKPLNCTSLELKSICSRYAISASNFFELYQFGIEICFPAATACRVYPLWIVPVWNWNMFHLRLFLSHHNLWIVPVWNWNHGMFATAWGFLSLWIVPVWNWNLLAHRCAAATAGPLNCTSLELKWRSYSKNQSFISCFELYQFGIEIIFVVNLMLIF